MRDFTFIAEHVTKTLHGKNTGPWSLSFKVFRDNNQHKRQQVALKDSKLLYQVSLAQQPGHVYCMVDGSVVVEAEKEMELILSRLKNLWQLRQSVTIEVLLQYKMQFKFELKRKGFRAQAMKLVISH